MMSGEQKVEESVISGEAWERFCDNLKESGCKVFDNDFATSALDKTEGYRYLTRLLRYGFEVALEFSDPDFPVFYQPSHETLKIMADNPDTLHFMASVRGNRKYTIRGNRGTVNRIVFTSLSPAGAAGGLKLDAGFDTSELGVDTDGNFEIVVSKASQKGNWLPLIDESSCVLVRAIFLDRERETAPKLTIAPAVKGGAPDPLNAQRLTAALDQAVAVMAGTASHVVDCVQAVRSHNWINELGEDTKLVGAGDPSACYFQGFWELADDDALVVDIDVPECFFWNFQVNNCWMESLDYRYSRIHVNKRSAQAAPDGSVRIVIAHRDPGVPNWLATDGHNRGTLMSRWIEAKTAPVISTRVVKHSTLKKL